VIFISEATTSDGKLAVIVVELGRSTKSCHKVATRTHMMTVIMMARTPTLLRVFPMPTNDSIPQDPDANMLPSLTLHRTSPLPALHDDNTLRDGHCSSMQMGSVQKEIAFSQNLLEYHLLQSKYLSLPDYHICIYYISIPD